VTPASAAERARMDRVAVTERPWDDMTPDERRDEMDRAAAELLRPFA